MRGRKELYTGKSKDSKYKEDIKQRDLLKRWPKFLDLQAKLPGPGGLAALLEMQLMCPRKDATKEAIGEVC